MPVYEFECDRCGMRFEEFVRSSDQPACPDCGSGTPRRLFSPPGIAGRRLEVTGLAARRGEAERRGREDARRERLAETKRKRAAGEPIPARPRRKKGGGDGP